MLVQPDSLICVTPSAAACAANAAKACCLVAAIGQDTFACAAAARISSHLSSITKSVGSLHEKRFSQLFL